MDTDGGAENAGVENAGVENAGADSKGGKCRSGKCRSDNVWKAVRRSYSTQYLNCYRPTHQGSVYELGKTVNATREH